MTKLIETLYKQILSDLIKENEFHDHMFSIKDLEKVASNRTLKLINSND